MGANVPLDGRQKLASCVAEAKLLPKRGGRLRPRPVM